MNPTVPLRSQNVGVERACGDPQIVVVGGEREVTSERNYVVLLRVTLGGVVEALVPQSESELLGWCLSRRELRNRNAAVITRTATALPSEPIAYPAAIAEKERLWVFPVVEKAEVANVPRRRRTLLHWVALLALTLCAPRSPWIQIVIASAQQMRTYDASLTASTLDSIRAMESVEARPGKRH